MATRGRKAVPTELHKLRGTLNPTRHKARVNEPKPAGELGEAPGWMTRTQREGWAYARAHAPAGLLRMIDRTLLAIWVVAEDRFRIATVAQAEADASSSTPLLQAGREGAMVASPYLAIVARQSEIMLRAAAELGFTPASRPRLAAPPAGDKAEPTAWDRIRAMQGAKDAA